MGGEVGGEMGGEVGGRVGHRSWQVLAPLNSRLCDTKFRHL